MNKRLIIIFLLLFGAVSALAQTEQKSEPVKWELYRVSAKKVSVLLPKMPVLISNENSCSQIKTDKYAVYADDVIYGLNIYSKRNEEILENCPSKIKFDESSFLSRINEVKTQLNAEESKKISFNNIKAEFIKNDVYNHWLINDFKNDQWIELWTANAPENTVEVKNLIGSLKINLTNDGIEIGKGAESNTGGWSPDFRQTETPENSSDENKDKLSKIVFVVKPSPKYTNKARIREVQGQVVLRITFLANGGIGSISPVKGLDDGLTEEAVDAAKKIIFIPAKRNGKNVSVTMSLQYTFKIY